MGWGEVGLARLNIRQGHDCGQPAVHTSSCRLGCSMFLGGCSGLLGGLDGRLECCQVDGHVGGSRLLRRLSQMWVGVGIGGGIVVGLVVLQLGEWAVVVEHRVGVVCAVEVSWTLAWRAGSHSSPTDRLLGRPSLGWGVVRCFADLHEGETRTHSSRLISRLRVAARRLGL